eukprot:gene13623-biopygen13395
MSFPVDIRSRSIESCSVFFVFGILFRLFCVRGPPGKGTGKGAGRGPATPLQRGSDCLEQPLEQESVSQRSLVCSLARNHVFSNEPYSGSELERLPISAAVCCGSAVCGDFGSRDQQRFMSIGGVSSFVVVIERVATRGKEGGPVYQAVSAIQAEPVGVVKTFLRTWSNGIPSDVLGHR